jgi:hypothetical protein
MIPSHHERYARAWDLYLDESLSDGARRSLEQEMDSAQNHFTWDEFQAFKLTLPGFVEHWDGMKKDVEAKMVAKGLV